MKINTTKDKLNNTAGILLAGKIFKKNGLFLSSPEFKEIRHKESIRTMAGLMVQGRNSFCEVELVRNDPLFKKSLNLKKVQAQETLRLYLNKLAKQAETVESAIDKVNLNLIKNVTLSPTISKYNSYIPVDIDVSPMDNSRTKKEGVGRTYKGCDGYAPIFSYIGAEGYMLSSELRPGTQHCQKHTPAFLQKMLKTIDKIDLSESALIRMDSGNDSKDTLRILMQSNHFFLVKRNLRRENKDKWLAFAQTLGNATYPREGKIVYTGSVTSEHPLLKCENLPAIDQVFKITVRNSDHSGNVNLFPEIDIEVYWTNLYESAQSVIDLYHDHGTSEQFHSELKSDMDFERFPSGKMAVNSILLHIAMIAFNTLRLIGQTALLFKKDLPYKSKVRRKRLRKVIMDLIFISCKIVNHAGSWTIRIWEHNPWYTVFCKIYKAI